MLAISMGALSLTNADANGVQFTVSQFDGWGGPSTTISPVQKPRQAGAWAGDAFSTVRHITVGGLIIAPTQDLLVDAANRLVAAVPLSTQVMTVTEASTTRYLNVRASDEIIITYITDTIASYSLQVIAVDPRKTGTPLVGVTFLPATTGGLTIPYTVPFSINSTVVSGIISLYNPGNTPGLAIFRLDGPTTGPIITHQGATGNSLVFSSSLALNAGEWLTINNDAKTALANDQSPRNAYITSRGWSAFDPGLNTWSFTASTFNAASKLTVTATPSWL